MPEKSILNFYQLLWITCSILLNFNAKRTLYSVIGGANLAEFEVGEGCF